MSTINVPHRSTKVKARRKKFDRLVTPSPEEIPSLWAELSALASIVPPNEAGGVHRLRSRLLDGVPPWQLPAFLDSLQEVTA